MASGKLNPCLLISGALILIVVIVIAVVNLRGSTDNNDAASANGTRVTSTLRFVVLVARHGKRGPYYSCPKCPYQRYDKTYWPYGYTELTNRGRVQMYQVGLKLRSLYNGFLSQMYFPEEFKVLSTNSNRTMMSGTLISAGLFPPTGFQVWSNTIPWQPIPVFSDDKDQCLLVAVKLLCPKYQEEKEKSWAKFEDVYGANMTELINSLQPYTGTSASTGLALFTDFMTIWESLNPADINGFLLPTWSKAVYPEPLRNLFDVAMKAYIAGSDAMVRLAEGLLFQEIVSLMQAKVNGNLVPNRQMVIYNGHDATIICLQGMLGLPDSERPIVRTGSALIYELHQDEETSQHYVQILYMDGEMTDPEPVVVNIPSCPFPCDFNTLKNVTEKYYNITDYDKECEATNSTVTL